MNCKLVLNDKGNVNNTDSTAKLYEMVNAALLKKQSRKKGRVHGDSTLWTSTVEKYNNNIGANIA